MSLPIHYRLEKSFQYELQTRVPGLTWHVSQERPEGSPPYGVIQCDEAREKTPESGVFYVQMAVLVTHLLDEEKGRPHLQRVQEVRQAIEALPRPGVDEDNLIRIYGFVLMRSLDSNTELEQGTLFELNVGCGVWEKQEGGPMNTPDVES